MVEQQTYYCPWKAYETTASAAKNCNNCYDDYRCKHEQGGFCCAKDGLVELAKNTSIFQVAEQSHPKCKDSNLMNQCTREMLSSPQGFLLPEDLKENGGDF